MYEKAFFYNGCVIFNQIQIFRFLRLSLLYNILQVLLFVLDYHYYFYSIQFIIQSLCRQQFLSCLGFIVPDVKYNEAYISFVLVHPEWRRAGIGNYMIYHLIQTCLGKDVTLHASVTNPAMLMYQKFGFKPEEFIRDFYNQYLPDDSPQCSHAFFLLLRR